jgi:hypothetical protein
MPLKKLPSFSLDADRAPQLKASVMLFRKCNRYESEL